jgi:c-di-GMP-binding flagellar brake protein YcgR
MDLQPTERRRYIRIYFDNLTELQGKVAISTKEDQYLNVPILDLSLGGVHFTIEEPQQFLVGDRLTLVSLQHRDGLHLEEKIAMEIRWVFIHPDFRRTYVGCMFTGLSDQSQQALTHLIESKLKETAVQRSVISGMQ